MVHKTYTRTIPQFHSSDGQRTSKKLKIAVQGHGPKAAQLQSKHIRLLRVRSTAQQWQNSGEANPVPQLQRKWVAFAG